MSEGSLISPNNDSLSTPKESIKTPKFREFHEMSGCLAALKSPRDLDSINTPLLLPTPIPNTSEGLLSTPTLGTPRTADPWNGLFSPLALASNCSSPTTPHRARDPRPSDLPLDSSIGLSSPHDGVLAKRRKLKNLNSSHSRSVESDSNSCDTPTTDSDSVPRDLSKKGERERSRSDSSPSVHEEAALSPRLSDLDRVRDRVGAFAISTSPSWRFKHPKPIPESLRLSKDMLAHPSPLAVPSPNWTTISRMMSNDGLALQTPKVLDNFVFDVLPPNTPNTPKVSREKSPENSQPLNYEKHKTEKRPCLPESPPPPYPEDLSIHKNPHPVPLTVPKQEPHYPDYRGPPSPREVKEEPQEYTAATNSLPRDFPPYYLQPGINPQHFYRSAERPASPPASPPSQYHRQFYPGIPRHPSLSAVLTPHYGDPGSHPPPSHWWAGHHEPGPHLGNGHLPGQQQPHLWRGHTEQPGLQGLGTYGGIKPNLDLDKVKSEVRLSTESQDYSQDHNKKKARKSREEPDGEGDPNQPPKKRGKGKGKAKDTNGGPKRVFICPHCQRSYDWNYNLNRHLKYECGKENAFMCSKCGRRFPHKQNCVYHLKRKHKIICETIDQYVSAGLVVFQGNGNPPGSQVGGGTTPSVGPGDQHSPNGGSFSNSPGDGGGVKEHSITPPPSSQTAV